MKRFLINILVFAILSLIALFVTDCICSKQLRSMDTLPYAVWSDIIEDRADSDVLVMGNSRAWTSYSPVILDSILGCKTYNLGIDGSAFNRQCMRYEAWRHYYPKPKMIIQNIDYFSLSDWTTGYMDYQFFPFFSNRYIREAAFSVESFSFAQKYLPMYRYTRFGLRKMLTSENYPMFRGYHGVEKEWDGRAYQAMDSFHFSYQEDALQLFSQSLAKWRDEGIMVVLVFAPMYSGVTSRIDNIEEMYGLFQDLSRKYNTPILDFGYDSMCSDTTLFYNATHLNKRGGELFSRKLALSIDTLSLL